MLRKSRTARRVLMAAAMALVVAGMATGNPVETWTLDDGYGWGLGFPTR